MKIINLQNRKDLWDSASRWFHQKWKVPESAYLESMKEAEASLRGVPRWYVVQDEEGALIGGVGVIENDFHQRPDLRPNLCGLFVEVAHRGNGIARALIERICEDLFRSGEEAVYLITGHGDGLYERLGWSFYGEILENDGSPINMYHRKTKMFESERNESCCN